MKLFKLLLLLATLVSTCAVSTSCSKDDDEPWDEYKETHRSLDFEGTYVVYPKDEFTQYHTNRSLKGFYFDYQMVSNATKYLADTTCYIIYEVSEKEVSDIEYLNEVNAEFDALNYNYYEEEKEGEKAEVKLPSVDETVTRMTYYEVNRPYKAVYYFVKNSKTGRAYRLYVVAPTNSSKFWSTADDILATFRFNN